jgi:hypothetical protein
MLRLGIGMFNRGAPVLLYVTALEMNEQGISHLHGLYQAGKPWRLSMSAALAAVESDQYAIYVGYGTKRCRLTPSRTCHVLEAVDRYGNDRLADLPLVTVGAATSPKA